MVVAGFISFYELYIDYFNHNMNTETAFACFGCF